MHNDSNEEIDPIITDWKAKWEKLKKKIVTAYKSANKVMKKYKEIIELAEEKAKKIGKNTKSLK